MLQAPGTFSKSITCRAAVGYVCVLALLALVPVGIVSLINFAVDPFQFFRKAERAKFSVVMMRHQMPGVIRNYPFDAAVVGHSLAGKFRPEHFSDYKPKLSVQNLVLFGGTLNETAEVATLALRKKTIKVLFWSIGYQNIEGDYRFPDFPHCMYSRWLEHFPACYLLNVDVLRVSVPGLLGLQIVDKAREWRDDLTRWQNYPDGLLDLSKHGCELKRFLGSIDNIARMTKRGEDLLYPLPTPDARKFSRIILPIVDAHPEVKFVFFVPPIFATAFWLHTVNGEISGQQFIKQELLKRANVELFNFQTHHALTGYPPFFLDLFHGNEEVAGRMAYYFSQGKFRVTDMAQDKEELRQELREAAPRLASYFNQNCAP